MRRLASQSGRCFLAAGIIASCVALMVQGADTPKETRAKGKAAAPAKAAPAKATPAKAAPAKAEPTFGNLRESDLDYPPKLPNGATLITDTSEKFLQPPASLRKEVKVAKAAPTVDFTYYPGQDYVGVPWSNWGDGCVANGKYYSAIGDHRALGRKGIEADGNGNAMVYEYDPATKVLKKLCDTRHVLNLPNDHYWPGKIHTRVDIGRDGWAYFATHRGSPAAASDANHYRGDWIFRCDPVSGKAEVVVHAPVPKHSIPNSVLDPERLIFYGGTAAGPDSDQQDIQFFAYDVANRKLLYSGPQGPARYMILAQSTGCVYYVPGNAEGKLMRYDPSKGGSPVELNQVMGIRAATQETPAGLVYTVSSPSSEGDADVWEFNTKTEQVRRIGSVAVGGAPYVASIDVDPTGRYLYYSPGAHGSGYNDGTPIVQFDVKTGKKKVIAFLHPFYQEKYGFIPKGTYSTALSAEGDKLFVTWNVSRGTRAWDCCGLSVVHIPASER